MTEVSDLVETFVSKCFKTFSASWGPVINEFSRRPGLPVEANVDIVQNLQPLPVLIGVGPAQNEVDFCPDDPNPFLNPSHGLGCGAPVQGACYKLISYHAEQEKGIIRVCRRCLSKRVGERRLVCSPGQPSH